MQESSDKLIEIQLLGQLGIRRGGRELSDQSGRTKQVWNFLEFLLVNRGKPISQEQLVRVLWPHDHCENPANALKNLAYRLRTALTALDAPGESVEYILLKRGVYSWNSELPCRVDTEELDELFRRASQEVGEDERIRLYERAVALYKGDFLPKASYEEWVIPLTEHYRSVYMRCVFALLGLLAKRERYREAVDVCRAAIAVDPFVEDLHVQLLRALVALGQTREAMEHYDYVNKLFYRELGIQTSEVIRSIYREIARTSNEVEMDITSIREALREQGKAERAFLCEFEVFKSMYRVEARMAARLGLSAFIGLFTVVGRDGNPPELPLLTLSMESLEEAILTSLRMGDVVARYSGTQYIVMLTSLTFENGEAVLNRIDKRFRRLYKSRPITLHKSLYPLEPLV